MASGPSFTEDQAQQIIEARESGKCRVIVVNRSWERVPNADVLYAADLKWWHQYWPAVERGFRGECWTCCPETAREYGLCFVSVEPGTGLDPNVIRSGGNGGYQAIGLAYKFGAQKIILVGYDMQYEKGDKGRRHWHEDYPSTVERTKKGDKEVHWSNASGVREWRADFTPLARDLKHAGIDVVNCTISTALPQFRLAGLRETLAAL